MTNPTSRVIINLAFAGVAHLVERDLAKVEVASSSLVARSRKAPSEKMVLSFCRQPRELAASTCAQRVKSYEVRQGSREWPLPFVGCREASSSLVARSKEHHLRRWCFLFLQTAPRTRCLDLRAAREIIRGEAGLPRMAIAIRGMPGSEFEPRRPLQKSTI